MGSKIEEAQELIKQAEKYMKTSLLKWKPDYELAADAYGKAATCFKNARSLVQSRDCQLKAVECHKQARSFFSAAKCLEQAVLCSRDLNDFDSVVSLSDRACNLYLEHGTPDTGALALDRSAKILEQHKPEEALRLYQRAIDVTMMEDRPRQAAEYASKAARILVKLRRYEDAIKAVLREMGYHQSGENPAALSRLVVCLIMLNLAVGDPVATSQAFQHWASACQPEELQVADRLVTAFEEEDEDEIRAALASPFIRHMDVEYAKLAKEIKLPEGIKQPVRKNIDSTVQDMGNALSDLKTLEEEEEEEYETEKDVQDATEKERMEDQVKNTFESKQVEPSEDKGHHVDEDEFDEGLC